MHVSEANRIVYLKKKARNQSANFPGDAEGGLCGVALKTEKGTCLILRQVLCFSAAPAGAVSSAPRGLWRAEGCG